VIGIGNFVEDRVFYGYFNIVLAALWLPAAWMNWSRLRKLPR
jgi:hypothetical protein